MVLVLVYDAGTMTRSGILGYTVAGDRHHGRAVTSVTFICKILELVRLLEQCANREVLSCKCTNVLYNNATVPNCLWIYYWVLL